MTDLNDKIFRRVGGKICSLPIKLVIPAIIFLWATACRPGGISNVKVVDVVKPIESQSGVEIPTNYLKGVAGVWKNSGRDGVTTIHLVRLDLSEQDYQLWLSNTTNRLTKNELWSPIRNEALEQRFPWWNSYLLKETKCDYYYVNARRTNVLIKFSAETFKQNTNRLVFIEQLAVEDEVK